LHTSSYSTTGEELKIRHHVVHHAVLKGFYSVDCQGPEIDLFEAASDIEGAALVFPSGVALNISTFAAFRVQMHYDNRHYQDGIVDNSAIRVHWTQTKPLIVAGQIHLGDPQVRLAPGLIPQGPSEYVFECGSSCTKQFPHDIYLMSQMHHMHERGRRMTTQLLAPDGKLVNTVGGVAEFFDFHKQRNVVMAPIKVPRGHSLRLSCMFDTPVGEHETPVTWGLESNNEMCIDFLYYYPASPAIHPQFCGINACGTLRTAGKMVTAPNFNRSFGKTKSPNICATTPSPPTATKQPATPPPTPAATNVVIPSRSCVNVDVFIGDSCSGKATVSSLLECGKCVTMQGAGRTKFSDCGNSIGPLFQRGCSDDCSTCQHESRVPINSCGKHLTEFPFVSLLIKKSATCTPEIPNVPVGTRTPVFLANYVSGTSCSSNPWSNLTLLPTTCFVLEHVNSMVNFCVNNVIVTQYFASSNCAPASMYTKQVGETVIDACTAGAYKASCAPISLGTSSFAHYRIFNDDKCLSVQQTGRIATGMCVDQRIVRCVNNAPTVSTYSDSACTQLISSAAIANRACQSRQQYDCGMAF
jgi:hypothetical protein